MKCETVKLGEYLYIKGRIGWKGLKKNEYLDNSEYRIINGETLTVDGIDWSKAGYITEERYMESPEIMLQENDILISKDGTIGKIGYVDKLDMPTTVASGIFVIRNEKPEIIDTKFIYHFLRSPYFKAFIEMRTEGSVIPHLYQKDFVDLDFPLYPLEIQQKISSILNVLDEKIALNKEINNNLEQQGAALFKKMFIDENNNNWKYGTLANLGTVVGGSTPSKAKEEYYTNNGIAWITPKDLSGNHSKFISHGANDITELGLKNSSASIMPRGTVLFSSRAPIGYIAIAKNDVTTNQGFKSVIPNVNIGTAYIYYLLKHSIPALESVAIGSTFKEVSGAIMKNFEVIIPDQEKLTTFNSFCETLFYQQEMLEQENQYLENLRNVLLPQLLSGKVDCSNVTI